MKLLQSLVAQVSLRTQGGILALGILFILLDLITEPLYPVIDLAWVTVIICGLPLLVNSVQSIWDNLEIHANFLVVIAMVALIAIGDYHTAAYVGIIVHAGFSNPQVDQLLDAAETEFDPAKRRDYAIQIQQLLMNDGAALFLGYPKTNIITGSYLKGAVMYPSDYYWITNKITK